jgi:ribonuclease P protein component
MKPFSFPKSERLCRKKSIDQIFESGKNVFNYPIKAIYTISPPAEGDIPCQVLFVVPKKKFKRAVHRNAIRRKIREAYRLNKQTLIDWCLINKKVLRITFIFIASEEVNYNIITESINRIFELIQEHNS